MVGEARVTAGHEWARGTALGFEVEAEAKEPRPNPSLTPEKKLPTLSKIG